MLGAAGVVELWELEFAFMADLIHSHRRNKAKCVKPGAGSEDSGRRLWSMHCWSVSHCAGLSITVCMVSFRRAESPGTPETCAPLVQALARKQPEQLRAAWLVLGNVEAIKAGPQLTAAQDWGAGSQLRAVGPA